MTDNPLANEIQRAGKQKLNVALPPRPEMPDDAVSARSREIGEKWGAATQLQPAERPAPLISVRFDCPDYLDRAISIAAAEQGVTKTFLILKAMKLAGYELADVDLVADRRKVRRRTG